MYEEIELRGKLVKGYVFDGMFCPKNLVSLFPSDEIKQVHTLRKDLESYTFLEIYA